MIAATRRMATLDFLLVAFSAIVALQAFWPAAAPRQTVQYRDAGGRVHRYSLAIDDPRLKRLTQAVKKPSRPRPTAALAKLKWLAETADFYVGRTEPRRNEPGFVLPVSYRENQSAAKSTNEADVLAAEQNYWIEIRDENRQKVAQAEAKLRLQQSLAVPSAIVFGDTVHGAHSTITLVTSALLGVCIAGFFALWTYACPAICLRADRFPPELETRKSDWSPSRDLRLLIPSRWVRVHQPASVTIRRLTQTVVVAAGLASLFASVS
jgi:hypothetical protein